MVQYEDTATTTGAKSVVESGRRRPDWRSTTATGEPTYSPASVQPVNIGDEIVPTQPDNENGSTKYVYVKQAAPKYNTPTLPGATSQEAYINSIYDADRRAQEAQLRSAYEQNMADLDYQAAQIPKNYNAAADDAAVQAAIARANFNQSAAGSGLNNGAAGQVALSQNNNYLRNVNAIRTAQAEATQKLALQRQQQEAQYKSAINAALAQNDLARAQALYQEAKRVDEANMNRAAQQAQMDWTVWNALYNRR